MQSIAWWPTVVVLAIATFTDIHSRRIPNWLVLPFLCVGVGMSYWFGGWHGVGQSFSGVALGASIYGVLCWMGGMGMGDLKLVAAIGAWVGPSQLLTALILTGIVGALMALSWAAVGGFLGDMFGNVAGLMLHIKERGVRPHPTLVISNAKTHRMPYAPAIAIGTLVSFLAH